MYNICIFVYVLFVYFCLDNEYRIILYLLVLIYYVVVFVLNGLYV